MDALSEITVPDDPGPFKRAEDRRKPYLDDPDSASVFAGPVLTHSDWTPDNVLVSPHHAWLIDWAWPTLGAAWTDPACWVLRLMASGGHTAPEAEQQASRLPASPATWAACSHTAFRCAAVSGWPPGDPTAAEGPGTAR